MPGQSRARDNAHALVADMIVLGYVRTDHENSMASRRRWGLLRGCGPREITLHGELHVLAPFPHSPSGLSGC